ncbi:MAG: MogA/MoaB family molybdenum cofactor biosynthesis protein [Spirochaetales bacterium]|nr:MogA/MoaB family molybdenum cofactor biosynthesis protein [Spirochaetales bacterium]
MTVAVITISDRASRGEYEDLSGPEIEAVLHQYMPEAVVHRHIVPDEPAEITAAFGRSAEADFILTTGGTGIGPRDVTPEVTVAYCDRLLPGIAETLRAESLKETPQAMLSRGTAGVKKETIIVNFPGSVKAVRLCTTVLVPVMEHAVQMLRGAGH